MHGLFYLKNVIYCFSLETLNNLEKQLPQTVIMPAAPTLLLEEVDIVIHTKQFNESFPSDIQQLEKLEGKPYQLKTTRGSDIDKYCRFLIVENVVFVLRFSGEKGEVLESCTPLYSWDTEGTISLIPAREITVRFFSGPENPIGVINTMEDFRLFPERKATLQAIRRADFTVTSFFVHKKDSEEKCYVLHFTSDKSYKLLAYERLTDWDEKAYLVLQPKK